MWRTLPSVLVVAGFIGLAAIGLYASTTDSPPPLVTAVSLLCIAVGLLAGGWYSIQREERTTGGMNIRRQKHPVLFWIYVLVLDFGLALTTIVIAIWLLLR